MDLLMASAIRNRKFVDSLLEENGFENSVPRCPAITNSAGALISAVSDGSLNHRSSSIGLPGPTTARMIPPRRMSIGPNPTEALETAAYLARN
jgi:hypothetical protein